MAPLRRRFSVAGRVQNGGGLLRSASLSRRSAAMALAVVCARGWRRLGIITARSPVDSTIGGSSVHRVAVGQSAEVAGKTPKSPYQGR